MSLDLWNKMFHAMMRDIDVFLVKHGCSKPKSNAERLSYLHDLESRNPEIADLSEKLAARFAMYQVCFAERREEFAMEETRRIKEIIKTMEICNRQSSSREATKE